MSEVQKIIDSLDYSEFNNEKTCLSIVAYNRPHYLKQVVDSLNKCEELANIPIFIFLDNGFKAKVKENAEVLSSLKYKYKFLKIQDKNLGCERNMLDAMYTPFEKYNFKNLLYIEDDLVVCKNYFKYIFESYKNIKNKDPFCATFQGWTECRLGKEEKKSKLDLFQKNTGENLWGYIIEKQTWDKIKPIVDGYRDIFNTAPYDGSVKIYRDSVLAPEIKKYYFDNIKKYNCQNKDVLDRYNNTYINLSIDEILALSINLNNMSRYYPVVNRSIYIGEEGLHSSVGDFKRLGFDKIKLEEF